MITSATIENCAYKAPKKQLNIKNIINNLYFESFIEKYYLFSVN